MRVAVGRRGESVDILAGELARLYGAVTVPADNGSLRPLAEYAAGWIPRATDAAKRMQMQKAGFLAWAKNRQLVKFAVLSDDDLHRKIWREAQTLHERLGYGPGTMLWKDESWSERARPCDSDTHMYKHAGCGIGKMIPTGEYTTRGKPILRPVGRELSFRAAELHLYPQSPLRWTERELIGFPVTSDWGTRQRRAAGVKARLKKDHRAGPVKEWRGDAAIAHCMAHPAQPGIARVNSKLEPEGPIAAT